MLWLNDHWTFNVTKPFFCVIGSASDDNGSLYTGSEKEVSAAWVYICNTSCDWLDPVHTSRCTNITKFQCHWCCYDIWSIGHGFFPWKSARSNIHYEPWDHTGDFHLFLTLFGPFNVYAIFMSNMWFRPYFDKWDKFLIKYYEITFIKVQEH